MEETFLPNLIISKDLIERIQFSVSSRNAEAKVGECAAHVFAAHYSEDPNQIKWQYVSSGVSCLLRNRELTKNGRKYMWSMSLCLYNASYGVLVWKAKLLPNSDYTAVADNFHVFALGEVNVLVGLMFSSKERACEILAMYNKWHQERMRDDGKRGYISSGAQSGTEPERFRKEMISKPCNFQHIQGTQAIDECMDIEKIKADIVAAFFGLGTKAGRSETDSEAQKLKSKKKKKEPVKQKLEFKEIGLPQTQSLTSPPVSPASMSGELAPSSMEGGDVPPLIQQNSQGAFVMSLPPAVAAAGTGEFLSGGGGGGGGGTGNGFHQDSGFQGSAYQDNSIIQQNAVLLPQSSSASLQAEYPTYGNEPNGYPRDPVNENQTGRVSQNSNPGSRREIQTGSPNYQNPASPSYQEYSTNNQGSYTFSLSPPRLDINLERELAESALFKPPIMSAN